MMVLSKVDDGAVQALLLFGGSLFPKILEAWNFSVAQGPFVLSQQ